MRKMFPETMNKIKNYSASDFHYRIKRIQSILKQNNLETMLIINGSDGNNNKANNIMMNYLFKGTIGTQQYSK